MNSENQNQLNQLIISFKQIIQCLEQKIASESSYVELIEFFRQKTNFLTKNERLKVKLVSRSADSVLKLQTASKDNAQLRSLYDFEAIAPFKHLNQIVRDCSLIVIIFQSERIISEHQLKLIELAQAQQVDVTVLVEQSESTESQQTFASYLKQQKHSDIKQLLLTKSFFAPSDHANMDRYQRFLLDCRDALTKKLVSQHLKEAQDKIELIFNREKNYNWQQVKQIESRYLKSNKVHEYRQRILIKKFNSIERLQQQKSQAFRQEINQLKKQYLNIFMPDSWLFQLQEIISNAELKSESEKDQTYLYLTVAQGDRREYLHSYILNLYQQQIDEVLDSQWANISCLYGDGGLAKFVKEANQKISELELWKSSDLASPTLDFSTTPSPKLDIAEIVDLHTLKLQSKLLFDYNYTQSSWFKLLMSGLIGMGIYLVTKLYSGTGRYIGFFILIFQIINIVTGQSLKQAKLKSHQKELRRMVNSKYQTLARLVVEQIAQTLILSFEAENKKYQAALDDISELAETRLAEIKQKIEGYQTRSNQLEQHRVKINSWLK
ncbi:MAG: hypothetical protein AAGE96_19015 [Cyanobacteria bacterium P01_G01_bin.19]